MTIQEIISKYKNLNLIPSGLMDCWNNCRECKKKTNHKRFTMGHHGRYVWICIECGNY